MRVKIDENLPERVAGLLVELGHDADTVRAEGLAGNADAKVWDAAQRTQRFLITQDLDFSDARKYAPGTHCGILLVRLVSPSRFSLILRVREIFETESVDDWQKCFVVATERKSEFANPCETPKI